ncbi:P2R1A-PPP2R2A-interacting phosphatase regulator 1-like isoform X5 [Stegostoma tigrinum]|uniref:P2R1A-PPP2R2A-interacting phosphatase regulator 1-like isoform X5 n=1 Tax=Stegostoma tigrinum TaxID=3053191 RepID=UPI002870845C|nr:P2R1A-PPP2R2A-interacting phosphatase regulator 1-like isoform X5 [Stegostoma tigrinum]
MCQPKRDSSPVFQPTSLRCRRSSASVNLSCPSSSFPLSPFRTFSSRIDQIRQEESMDVMNREAAHERGIHTAMQMSCSREDGFTLCDQMVTAESEDQILTLRREDIFPLSPSPSPTRIGKQYFSSSQLILIPKGGITPNSSPSPTRRIASNYKKRTCAIFSYLAECRFYIPQEKCQPECCYTTQCLGAIEEERRHGSGFSSKEIVCQWRSRDREY